MTVTSINHYNINPVLLLQNCRVSKEACARTDSHNSLTLSPHWRSRACLKPSSQKELQWSEACDGNPQCTLSGLGINIQMPGELLRRSKYFKPFLRQLYINVDRQRCIALLKRLSFVKRQETGMDYLAQMGTSGAENPYELKVLDSTLPY